MSNFEVESKGVVITFKVTPPDPGSDAYRKFIARWSEVHPTLHDEKANMSESDLVAELITWYMQGVNLEELLGYAPVSIVQRF